MRSAKTPQQRGPTSLILVKVNIEEQMSIAQQAAMLRGAEQFQDAISLIESNLPQLDCDTIAPALLEAFRTAKEMKDNGKAMLFAMAIASKEPELPSIQDYLP